jgi:hypothetical protein
MPPVAPLNKKRVIGGMIFIRRMGRYGSFCHSPFTQDLMKAIPGRGHGVPTSEHLSNPNLNAAALSLPQNRIAAARKASGMIIVKMIDASGICAAFGQPKAGAAAKQAEADPHSASAHALT